jgi:hypothetical protein
MEKDKFTVNEKQESAFRAYRRQKEEMHRVPSGRKIESMLEDIEKINEKEQTKKRKTPSPKKQSYSDDDSSSVDSPSIETLDAQFEFYKNRLEKFIDTS